MRGAEREAGGKEVNRGRNINLEPLCLVLSAVQNRPIGLLAASLITCKGLVYFSASLSNNIFSRSTVHKCL